MADWAEGLKFTKDPDEILDYKFDWSDWLNGDTISTRTVTVASGLTKDSDSITDTSTSVTVWLSGGSIGASYSVACKVVTAAGRTAERTVTIVVKTK